MEENSRKSTRRNAMMEDGCSSKEISELKAALKVQLLPVGVVSQDQAVALSGALGDLLLSRNSCEPKAGGQASQAGNVNLSSIVGVTG